MAPPAIGPAMIDGLQAWICAADHVGDPICSGQGSPCGQHGLPALEP
jgi:hypothetical protein